MPSNIYNENIYAPVRQTVAEVKYSLVAPEAKEIGVVQSPAGNPFSRSGQITNNITDIGARIATFEPDYWKLDGSFALPLPPEKSNMEVGWWSDKMSDENGILSPVPAITVTFPIVQNIKRFGIAFDEPGNNYCTDLEFTIYNSSNAVILNERISDNAAAYTYTQEGAQNVHRVEVRLYRTNNPLRYPRVSELDFGIIVKYTSDDIISLGLVTEANPTGTSFPYSELSLSIQNNGRFDQLDPQSYAQYLYTRQAFEYRHGLVLPDKYIEWVYCGVYYLDTWSVSDSSVQFTAVGKSSVLENSTYFNSTFDEMTVGTLIRRVLDEVKFSYYIDPALDSSPKIRGYFGNMNFRDVLAKLVELSCCLGYENQENTIEFTDISKTITPVDALDYDNMFSEPSMQLETYHNGINLSEYTISTENRQLSKTTQTVSGSQGITIYFDSPQMGTPSYTISQGFTLNNIKWYAMYMTATLTGNGAATITITGDAVNFAKSETFYNAPWRDPLEPDFPYKVDLPMMIQTTNYPAFRAWFLERKFTLLKKRLSCDIAWRQNPALQVGDGVTVQANKKNTVDMTIVKQSIEYNGGALRGTTKTVGELPL